MDKIIKGLIIGIIVGLIAGGTAGFFLHNIIAGRAMGKGNFPGNMQLTQSQISDVTSFFSSNPSADQVQTYCSQNRGYCFYYCRTINPSDVVCSNMMNQTFANRGVPNA